MNVRAHVSTILAAVLAWSAPSFASDVRVVQSGGTFTTIQAAVDASAEGDIVLVKAGNYAGFVISAKSLCVTAEKGEVVSVSGGTASGTVRVQNLAAGQSVAIHGIRMSGLHGPAFFAAAGAGSVRVTSCVAFAQGTLSASSAAVQLQDALDVAFNACTITSVINFFAGSPSYGPGVLASGSTFAIHDSTIDAADAPPGGQVQGNPVPGPPGSPGIQATSSTLVLVGSTVSGGNGGGGFSYQTCGGGTPTHGGNGGDALLLQGTSTATTLDVVLVPGAGGHGGTNTCFTAPDGSPGSPIVAPAGAVTALAGMHRELTIRAPVREGLSVPVTVLGLPGDQVVLLLSDSAAFSFIPVDNGALLLGAPVRRIALGTIPASGVFSASLPTVDLGAGIDGRWYHAQTLMTDTSGARWITGATPIVLLDQGI